MSRNVNIQKKKRQVRVRAKIRGTAEKPRLSVFRSNNAFYAQLIDDAKGITLLGVSEKHIEKAQGNKSERAKLLGLHIAKKALGRKITKAVFDRGEYMYHGRVKAFADGAREGGLKF